MRPCVEHHSPHSKRSPITAPHPHHMRHILRSARRPGGDEHLPLGPLVFGPGCLDRLGGSPRARGAPPQRRRGACCTAPRRGGGAGAAVRRGGRGAQTGEESEGGAEASAAWKLEGLRVEGFLSRTSGHPHEVGTCETLQGSYAGKLLEHPSRPQSFLSSPEAAGGFHHRLTYIES